MKSASYKLFVLKLYITNFFTQDHFHLAADFHKKMNEVRIKVMKGYKDDKASDEYYLLKKFNCCYSKIQKMKINTGDCLM